MKPTVNKYNELLDNIGSTLQKARENAIKAINTELVKANWEIGRHIVEFEQNGKEKADYGSALLASLAKDLKIKYGKGFSKSNIYLCRQFYLQYQKFQTVSGKLSWSHYAELLTISDDLARSFYEKQSIKENWSFREMKRQIDSALFQRLALSKDKKGVLALAEKGHEIIAVKEPLKTRTFLNFLNYRKTTLLKNEGLKRNSLITCKNSYWNLVRDFRLLQGNLKSRLTMSTILLTLFSITVSLNVLFL